MKAARRGLGPNLELVIDAHGSLEVATAINVAKELEPCDIALFEEPVSPAKLERALRARGWDVSVSNQGIRGGSARDAVHNIDLRIPPFAKLTIIQFGINDRNLLGASAGDTALGHEEIIRRVRAKGSAVILVRQWSPGDDGAFAAARQSVDSFVTWYSDLYYDGKLRPEYDSGDHAHLNAAGTDVIVARAAQDVERLLMQIGSRPTR